MTDKIYIKNLSQEILIGINPEERIEKQPVIVNVTLELDCSRPCQTDDIIDAVDYSIIHDSIVEHMNATHYDLVETLAENIANICLDDDRILSCIVRVDKPKALAFAESVAVEIFRKNK